MGAEEHFFRIQRIFFRPSGTQVILPNPPTVQTVGYFLARSGLILLLILTAVRLALPIRLPFRLLRIEIRPVIVWRTEFPFLFSCLPIDYPASA